MKNTARLILTIALVATGVAQAADNIPEATRAQMELMRKVLEATQKQNELLQKQLELQSKLNAAATQPTQQPQPKGFMSSFFGGIFGGDSNSGSSTPATPTTSSAASTASTVPQQRAAAQIRAIRQKVAAMNKINLITNALGLGNTIETEITKFGKDGDEQAEEILSTAVDMMEVMRELLPDASDSDSDEEQNKHSNRAKKSSKKHSDSDDEGNKAFKQAAAARVKEKDAAAQKAAEDAKRKEKIRYK